MMNNKRMILLNIILLIVLVGEGFAGYSFYDQSISYIKTDNAQLAKQVPLLLKTKKSELSKL